MGIKKSEAMRTLIRAYQKLVGACGLLQHLFLLAVRLYWGWQFYQTGSGKLNDISGPTKFFADLGIPLPEVSAWLVGLVETGGGILLMAGLFSRIASIPLTCTMVVAYLTAHSGELQAIFSDPNKFMSAGPFTFLMAALIVLLFGPGALSLDRLLDLTLLRKKTGV
jgi:putative oxidoreductase